MKIPGLTDLAADVKRIADALEKLAKAAESLTEKPATSSGSEKKYARLNERKTGHLVRLVSAA